MGMGRDSNRFDQKLKGLKRDGLRDYFRSDGIVVPQPNGETIRIPIRNLRIPRFIFGSNDKSGVGQGDGEIGDPIPGKPQDDQRGQEHGEGEGSHSYIDLNLEEAVEFLGEELELPNLLEKFEGNIGVASHNKYTGIQRVGPESLRHAKRTYKEALRRSISSGDYDPEKPVIIPIHDDKRYRSANDAILPTAKAAIIYLLDCSGSTREVLPFLQNVGWLADAWIQKHYASVARRYVQYDHSAKEVTADKLYSVSAGGGTAINAGLSLAKKIAQDDYPESDYNLYLIHFTDGDGHGMEITEEYVEDYERWIRRNPGLEKRFQAPKAGNPLADFLVDRCNAIFVCEAGAYSRENYSKLLQNLVEIRPSLDAKIRCVSFTEEEIEEGKGEKIKETLLHWFK